MTVVWIILGVIVYLAIGAMVAGIVNDVDCMAIWMCFWPIGVVGYTVLCACKIPLNIGLRINKWWRYRKYRKGE